MPVLQISPTDGLYYEYDAAGEAGVTFVFVNAITGDASMWQAEIAPALRAAGHGTLAYNFRGQAKSPYRPDLALDTDLIVADLQHLVTALAPRRPLLVGLSIGGLYALRAQLQGLPVVGLVLLNTLRRIGVRIDWINRGTLRCLQTAGPQLMKDMMMPLLCGPDFLHAHRDDFLAADTDYQPLAADSGTLNLVRWMGEADWDLAYEQVQVPTLVVTGLHDRVFYDADVVEKLAARLPHCQRIDIPDAGHMLPIEKPEAVATACLNFVHDL